MLDFFLQQLLTGKTKDLHPVVRDILHMGLYQIYELDKIPESAAVNESVDLVKKYCRTQRFAPGDIGIACMNMCHEAHSLGLATCMIGMNDQAKMEEYFGIPQGKDVRLVLAIGYAADSSAPVNKVRKPLEEVCSFNHW